MDTAILENLGLTKGEAKAYLALLELGKSTAGPIIKKSAISPSKIYDVLERLIQKGLASYIIEGKIKSFKAAEPKRLLGFLEQKKEALSAQETALKDALPKLEQKQKENKSECKAEIFEGIRGIKYFFDLSYSKPKRGEEICVIGYPREASKLFHGYFKNFHREQPKKGLHSRIIYNYDAWFGKKREKRKLTEQRYLPKGIETPAFIYIFSDIVGTIVITERQKLCFMIQNEEVAKSYLNYFNLMWSKAIKTGS